jgi:hypothetical protein
MPLITDYKAKLELDLKVTLVLIDGGENSLDIAAGESTLTPETVASETFAFNYLVARRDWIRAAIAKLDDGIHGGFDEIPDFSASEATVAEIAHKQAQMKQFSDLLKPIVIGADGGAIRRVPSA